MTSIIGVAVHARGSSLAVTVVPRSARNQVDVTADGELRLRVTAPPVNGAANVALLRLLAEALDIPRSRLEIDTGQRGRRKRIVVDGLLPDEVKARLIHLLSTSA